MAEAFAAAIVAKSKTANQTVEALPGHGHMIFVSLCVLIALLLPGVVSALDCITEIAPEYRETDPASLIHITDDASALALRAEVIDYIWTGGGFPEGQPFSVTPNQAPAGVDPSAMTNFSRVDAYRIFMREGFAANTYHFHPIVSNGRLVVLHQGHFSDFSSSGVGRMLSLLIEQGFSVITATMPGYSGNTGPAGSGHSSLSLFHTPEFNPLEAFLEPVAVSLNYAEANYSYTDISMMGLSGGGWATVVYAAIDPRVKLSIPVAGSLPLYLREEPCPTNYDWEQGLSGLYEERASYLDLYILGSFGSGRRQLQYLNQWDHCCFVGITYRLYEQHVIDAVGGLSEGSFEVYLDTSFAGHAISIHGQAAIMRELGLPVYEASTSEWHPSLRFGFWDPIDQGFNGSAWLGSSTEERYWFFFRDLEPGRYQIMATWVPDASYASNAPYTVYMNNQIVLTENFDQRQAPNDYFFNAFGWETLGELLVPSGDLKVLVTGDADGPVFADTVLFLRLGGHPDVDGDGVLSNFDGQGADGDSRCIGGNAVGCDDNCKGVWNPGQADSDSDGVGNACDNCRYEPNADQADSDSDGAGNTCDNCIYDTNADQVDSDSDGVGNACDNCMDEPNADQVDSDSDWVGNTCDNCMNQPNTDQVDSDQDGFGNYCDADFDNDGRVTAHDFIQFRTSIGSHSGDPEYVPAMDFNSSGSINGADFIFFRSAFGAPPGPSALSCAGTIPCE